MEKAAAASSSSSSSSRKRKGPGMRISNKDKKKHKKGPWTAEEDEVLASYIRREGVGRWRTLPERSGLERCGKSCRLRWMNYLRPGVKRGQITPDEEDIILRLHRLLGNRWSLIAGRISGRTDNEIKNYWNTHLSKKLLSQGLDPRTHLPLSLSNIQPPPSHPQQQQQQEANPNVNCPNCNNQAATGNNTQQENENGDDDDDIAFTFLGEGDGDMQMMMLDDSDNTDLSTFFNSFITTTHGHNYNHHDDDHLLPPYHLNQQPPRDDADHDDDVFINIPSPEQHHLHACWDDHQSPASP